MNYSQHLDESGFAAVWAKVQAFTMTSRERAFALWSAVNFVIDNDIPGAFVECGVWRGGSSMLVALTLQAKGVSDRDLYLLDTFSGMTAPSPSDQDFQNQSAADLMAGSQGEEVAELVRAAASLSVVRAAIESTKYNMQRVCFLEGDVRKSLLRIPRFQIAILRLDTDFYDSTMAELLALYPMLVHSGVLIVDDYGHWQGARLAVDEYFSDAANPYSRPMFWALDYTGRAGVKLESSDVGLINRYDYTPPNMDPPDLRRYFPFAEVCDPMPVMWPYLRKNTPHLWRSDSRTSGAITGNATVEEAVCLYTFSKQFAGKRGLEIGTHFGWTAAHLLAAGLELDCIDPAFVDDGRKAAIKEAFDRVSIGATYRLWPGTSPSTVSVARQSAVEPWSFVFIDGDHDGEAPATDASEVLKYLAPDAMVMFHDLTSPHVEKGLAVFREAGFSVCLINTMQVLGVAWRGNVVPPKHAADPNVPAITDPHLLGYSIATADTKAGDHATRAKNSFRPTLTIHIGWPKTGTSALQSLLAHNADVLLKQGVLYPAAERWENAHHRVCDLLMLHDDPLIPPPIGDINDLISSFGLEGQDPARHIVLSSEGFARATALRANEIALLNEKFKVRVLACLREPVYWANSLLNEFAKMKVLIGSDVDLDMLGDKMIRRDIEYSERLNLWANLLGRENIDVVTFSETDDFLETLCRRLGLDRSKMSSPPNFTRNKSAGLGVLQLISWLSREGHLRDYESRVLLHARLCEYPATQPVNLLGVGLEDFIVARTPSISRELSRRWLNGRQAFANTHILPPRRSAAALDSPDLIDVARFAFPDQIELHAALASDIGEAKRKNRKSIWHFIQRARGR